MSECFPDAHHTDRGCSLVVVHVAVYTLSCLCARSVSSVFFDGPLIYSASYDETIKIWSWPKLTCVDTLRGHNGMVFAVTQNLPLVNAKPGRRRGLLASGAFDNTVKIWSKRSRSCEATLHGHVSRSRQCIQSSQARGFEGLRGVGVGVHMRTAHACKRRGAHGVCCPVHIHPPCPRLPTIQPHAMPAPTHHYARAYPPCLPTIQPHAMLCLVDAVGKQAKAVIAVAFDEGGRRLASGSDDGTVRIWDVSSRCMAWRRACLRFTGWARCSTCAACFAAISTVSTRVSVCVSVCTDSYVNNVTISLKWSPHIWHVGWSLLLLIDV